MPRLKYCMSKLGIQYYSHLEDHFLQTIHPDNIRGNNNNNKYVILALCITNYIHYYVRINNVSQSKLLLMSQLPLEKMFFYNSTNDMHKSK
jgi:hypothetical protein